MPKPPSFKDYRATNDGVMVADIGFKRQLWALDEELDVVWDWASQKWEIWRFPGQKKKIKKVMDKQAHHVMTVETKDKNFRELGADILLKLQWGDTQRWSQKELYEYFEKLDDNVARAKENRWRDYFQSVALDTFDYVRGVLKVQVPRVFGVKPHEWQKHDLKVKKPKKQKIINAIGG